MDQGAAAPDAGRNRRLTVTASARGLVDGGSYHTSKGPMTIALKKSSLLTSEQWSAREDLLRHFEQAWRKGPRPFLQEYLPSERLEREAVLLELVQTDLEYRLKKGEPARVEEYLDRFPELKRDAAAQIELVAAEMNWRRRRETGLIAAEYVDRFPELGSAFFTLPQIGRSGRSAMHFPVSLSGDKQRLGKYEIMGIAGLGAFGIVYRARDCELDRPVALKVLRSGALASPEEADRLLREARSVGRLSHPNIVPVHDAGRDGETCFLATEFVAGSTLADRLATGPIPAREAAVLAAQLAEALQHAHAQGVIHRDVKPSNILLEECGTPRLTDFGLALRNGGENTLTSAGEVLGTPAYMPPEQARGESHQVDGRSDLYSLGVVLYEMLTGELPFRGSREMVLSQVLQDEPTLPRRLNSQIPRDIETICLKCLQKEPARRYASADALAADLRRYLQGEPIVARRVGRIERMLKWSKRNRWQTAFLLALLLGVIVSGWQAFRARMAENAAHLSAESARKSESQALATLDFFREKILAVARPKDENGGLGVGATIREAIDAAEPDIEKSFVDQPLVIASIRETLGKTYRSLGSPGQSAQQHELALQLRRKFLGSDHDLTLITMNNLALAYQNMGRLTLALPLQEEELSRSQRKRGPGRSHDPDLDEQPRPNLSGPGPD